MTQDSFNKIVEELVGDIRSMLIKKSAEYARNNNKLHNFDRAGEILRCSPAKALLGMETKHRVSLLDIVNDMDRGVYPEEELMKEKILDSLNYLILLYAIYQEGLCIQRSEENRYTPSDDRPMSAMDIPKSCMATLPLIV
jgi:hypothetical protein